MPRRIAYALAFAAPLLSLASAPPVAAAPVATRDLLIQAAYFTQNKAQAQALVNTALVQAGQALGRNPRDRDAAFDQAVATGYRAKLTRSLKDAKSARAQFEALAASDPRDAEAQLAIAAWHIESVNEVGAMLAGAMAGAKRATGLAALDRAVALGGNQAVFPGYGAILRLLADPGHPAQAQRLAEIAANAGASTKADQVSRLNARKLLVPLRAGDGAGAAKLAQKLVPFGQIAG